MALTAERWSVGRTEFRRRMPSRIARVFLVLGIVWPAPYFVFFLATSAWVRAHMLSEPSLVMRFMPYLFGLHAFTMLVLVGAVVVYVRHALRNSRLVDSDRKQWAAFLVVLGVVAMPIYYFRYVRTESQ